MAPKTMGKSQTGLVKWDFPTTPRKVTQVPSDKIKRIDDKGRLNLGKDFAGRDVRIDETAGGFTASYVIQVPAGEAWLWENEKALSSVRKGIEEAAAGELTAGPEGWDGIVADTDRSAAGE